ncbi:MAG TPA: GntR family transcriptional regulator [Burkholderiales bacterium]
MPKVTKAVKPAARPAAKPAAKSARAPQRARIEAANAPVTPLASGAATHVDLPRAEHAYQEIRRAIRQRRFRSGDRLREVELAESLGLSRTPVREALYRLLADGLATEHGQRGIMVAEFDHAMVGELYVMREMLEGMAARLAAQVASEVEIALLRELGAQYAALVKSGRDAELAEKNRQFHEALYRCAHNRFLLKMLDPLHDALGLLGDSNLADPARARANAVEHAEIVAAIARHDADAADKLTRAHIHEAHKARVKRLFASGAR